MRGLLGVGPEDFAGRVRLEFFKVHPSGKGRRTFERVDKLRRGDHSVAAVPRSAKGWLKFGAGLLIVVLWQRQTSL